MKRYLLFSLLAISFLSGCATFHDEPTVSVWAEGGWLVFWLPFLGSLLFFYLSYRASKSGSEALPNSSGVKPYKSDKNLPIYKTGGKFYFAVFLQGAAWFAVWYFNSNNWR